MDVAQVIKRLEEQTKLPLESRKTEVYNGKGTSSLQMAEVFYEGQYYGFVVLSTNETGDLNYCAYTGKHPCLTETKDWRDELGLLIQKDEIGLFRVDTNKTPFLDFGNIEPEELTRFEEHRRIPYWIGFGEVNCYTSNHRLKRSNQTQSKQATSSE